MPKLYNAYETRPHTEPAQLSKLCIVQVQEFGTEPRWYFARCWVSSETPNSPKWYLDPDCYGLDTPFSNRLQIIAGQVLYWAYVPKSGRYIPLSEQLERGYHENNKK